MKDNAIQVRGPSANNLLNAGNPDDEVLKSVFGAEGCNFVLIQTDVLAAFQPGVAGATPLLADMARVHPGAPLFVNVSMHAAIFLRRVAADANVTITPLGNGR